MVHTLSTVQWDGSLEQKTARLGTDQKADHAVIASNKLNTCINIRRLLIPQHIK